MSDRHAVDAVREPGKRFRDEWKQALFFARKMQHQLIAQLCQRPQQGAANDAVCLELSNKTRNDDDAMVEGNVVVGEVQHCIAHGRFVTPGKREAIRDPRGHRDR